MHLVLGTPKSQKGFQKESKTSLSLDTVFGLSPDSSGTFWGSQSRRLQETLFGLLGRFGPRGVEEEPARAQILGELVVSCGGLFAVRFQVIYAQVSEEMHIFKGVGGGEDVVCKRTLS